MKGGVISSGDPVTARAGIDILKAGGNAFDAAIAATFTSFVSESTLTSAGGGGFCLAHTANGKQVLFDFFTQTPRKKNTTGKLDFYDSFINFQDSIQPFKIGLSTGAVPGNIAGLFHMHKKLGSMPMDLLIEPALSAATEGVTVTPFIRYNFHVINDILLAEEPSQDIFKPGGKLLDVGDKYYFKHFGNMLKTLAAEGQDEFYHGYFAKRIVEDSLQRGGHLTLEDFANYKVIERKPLHFSYRGYDIYTNPPPSSGGILIGFMLKLLEKIEFRIDEYGKAFHLNCLVDTIRMTDKARIERFNDRQNDKNVAREFLNEENFLELEKVLKKNRSRFRNTTHLTVADKLGNVVTISTSFGTGCGYIMPGTDSMLNNMLGEEDLNPAGFHNWQPDTRITSMMSPTIVMKDNHPVLALGTGGANRIRTAIMQVISNYIDFKLDPDQTVNNPRIHWEDNILSYEPGFDPSAIEKIENIGSFEVIPYKDNNMFFGGVHAIFMDDDWDLKGAGDRRREGIVMEC